MACQGDAPRARQEQLERRVRGTALWQGGEKTSSGRDPSRSRMAQSRGETHGAIYSMSSLVSLRPTDPDVDRWTSKLRANAERDTSNAATLLSQGWRVTVI